MLQEIRGDLLNWFENDGSVHGVQLRYPAVFARDPGDVIMSLRPYLISVLLCLPFLSQSSVLATDHQLRVLLLTGKNNHDWQQTTPVLTRVLEESGRFQVRVLNDPSLCDESLLEDFDVVVSNWTNFPSREREWGQTAENAIMEFVRSGKGFVVVHAASATFPSWPDYQQLVGATWGDSTGHGAFHAFNVSVADTGHPVTRVVGSFTAEDELWHRMARMPEAHILCTAYSDTARGGSGHCEPVAYSTAFGRGRSFYLVLGHDVRAMLKPSWRMLLLRGAEWAATAEASIDIPYDIPQALQKAVSVAAPSREELGLVGQLVQSSSRNPVLRRRLAQPMAGMLGSDVSTAWKKFFCEQLSLIGTADEVPSLARLLNDPNLGFHARFALERIPVGESTGALREAAATAADLPLIGAINALGERKDPQAVELLGRYVAGNHDAAVKGAAVHALGKLGGPDAARLLRASPADGSLRLLVGESLLLCAGSFESAGDISGAAEIYELLNSSRQPPQIRAAAFVGVIRCREDRGPAMLTEAMQSGDDVLHGAVLRVLREPGGNAMAAVVAARTSKLPDVRRAQMFYALADVSERGALPDMYAAVAHRNRSLRTAAVFGIGKLGDSSSVGRLCAVIDKADAEQRDEIRNGLARLQGPGVDERLLALLSTRSGPTVKEQVISALAARDCRTAVPALLEAVNTGGAGVRKAGIEALGLLADGSVSPDLVRMLKSDRFAAERPSLVRTLIRVGLRDQTPDRVCNAVLACLSGSTPDARASMFQVLGRFGGEKAYQAIRSALSDPDPEIRATAIRVLSAWPDSAPMEDLLMLAHTPGDPGPRTLALRGGVGLLEKSPDLKGEERVRIIERELRSADSDEAKLLLISALGKQSSLQGLRVAVSCLDHPAIDDEAALAVVGIVQSIGKDYPAESRNALERTLESVQSPTVAKQVNSELARLDFQTGEGNMKVAVVTGGHEFDESSFLRLFTSDKGITYAHLPQTDDSELFDEIGGWQYDVIVLYNFTQKISERRRENFLRLLDNGVGVLSLHHASGAFQEWCEYPKIIGCRYLLSPVERDGVRREPSTYQHDVDIPVHVTDTTHAVTRGARDFVVHDETYEGCEFEPDNHLLLTTTEKRSDEPLGWARTYRRSRVVHFQLGHGPDIFGSEQFRGLVDQAVRWCAEGRREQLLRGQSSQRSGE